MRCYRQAASDCAGLGGTSLNGKTRAGNKGNTGEPNEESTPLGRHNSNQLGRTIQINITMPDPMGKFEYMSAANFPCQDAKQAIWHAPKGMPLKPCASAFI
jgi:hypothetical protein